VKGHISAASGEVGVVSEPLEQRGQSLALLDGEVRRKDRRGLRHAKAPARGRGSLVVISL